MLQLRKEHVFYSTVSGEKTRKYVELESKASEGVQKSIHVEPVDVAQGSTSYDDTLQKQVQYCHWANKKTDSST